MESYIYMDNKTYRLQRIPKIITEGCPIGDRNAAIIVVEYSGTSHNRKSEEQTVPV